VAYELNYDEWIHLDAEALAETGIGEAYEQLLPELRKYIAEPVQVEEIIDNDTPIYSVRCGGQEHVIVRPDLAEEGSGSWGRATFAFFAIVNAQLVDTAYRFYAINAGNDLGGMFLTPAQALDARASLPRQQDWPYIPVDEPPWNGQHH
jgi:hypothetical protein